VKYEEVQRWSKKLTKGIFGHQFLFFPVNQEYVPCVCRVSVVCLPCVCRVSAVCLPCVCRVSVVCACLSS
jgi:hypothetical protein